MSVEVSLKENKESKMAKKENDGKSGLNGIKVSDETRCQMKIIE